MQYVRTMQFWMQLLYFFFLKSMNNIHNKKLINIYFIILTVNIRLLFFKSCNLCLECFISSSIIQENWTVGDVLNIHFYTEI